MILDAWGWCTGMTQRDGTGREEGSGWGTHVYLWRIHVDIWQNQYNIVKLKKKTGHGTRTGSKLVKEYNKAMYCHPAYLTCMQSTSCEMLSWMNHKLEARLLGEISITADRQMIPL